MGANTIKAATLSEPLASRAVHCSSSSPPSSIHRVGRLTQSFIGITASPSQSRPRRKSRTPPSRRPPTRRLRLARRLACRRIRSTSPLRPSSGPPLFRAGNFLEEAPNIYLDRVHPYSTADCYVNHCLQTILWRKLRCAKCSKTVHELGLS